MRTFSAVLNRAYEATVIPIAEPIAQHWIITVAYGARDRGQARCAYERSFKDKDERK
jgi:hypothetical protein